MARKIQVQILGDSSSLERAFTRSSRAGSAFNRDISRAGRGIVAISAGYRGLARSVAFASAAFVGTAGLTAGLKASLTGFDQFQESLQKSVGLAGIAQSQVAGFSKQILQLSSVVGRSPQELANAFFFIASSGIDAAHAFDVLTESAKASVAGLGDTATVADAVTSAVNAYGISALSATQATDVLTATVKEGKGEADQFAGVIGNVAALASQLGVSFDQVGAALAAQTRLGTDAETAATQLQRVFSALIKVTPQQAKAFKSVGLNADQLRATLGTRGGLLKVLDEVRKAFAGNLPELAKAFGDVRAVRGVLALVGAQADATRGIFERMAKSAGATQKAFDAVSKTTAQRFRQMRASVEVSGIAIGAVFAPLAGEVAASLAKAADKFTAFVNRIAAAQTVHAKIAVVWDGIAAAVRSLGEQFQRVDWGGIARDLANKARQFLAQTDFAAAGRAVGQRLEAALSALGAAVGRVNWSEVGKQIVIGFGKAVRFVLAALPGVLDGIGKLTVKVLEGMGKLVEGAGKELGRALLNGISAGLKAAGQQLERLALQIVLKIIDPFTHLPKRLGGGPFQDLQRQFKAQLDAMVADSQNAAAQIQKTLGNITSTTSEQNPRAAVPGSPTFKSPVAPAAGKAAAKATAKAVTTATTGAAATATKAAATAVATGFTLPFRLQLAQAEAAATKSAADDLKIARDIRAFILKAIPHLHGEKLLGAYQELAQVNSTIADAVKAAADKVKSFTVPLALQVAQARATALGKDDGLKSILEKIKRAAEKALKSGRLGLQGQLDAWNTLGSVNDQLKNLGSKATSSFKKVNVANLFKGLGLTADQLRAARMQAAQIGKGGLVPGVASPAFSLASGGTVQVNSTIKIGEREIGRAVTTHQTKEPKRLPSRRG